MCKMSSFSLVVSYVNQIQDAELASNILKKNRLSSLNHFELTWLCHVTGKNILSWASDF